MTTDGEGRDVEKLKERINLLETLLLELASACWQQCGTDWIMKATRLIVEAEKD